MVTLKNLGAIKTVPKISKVAGRKHIRIAGRPTFFRSSIFRDNPALVKIITKASCLSEEEIFRIELSNRFKE